MKKLLAILIVSIGFAGFSGAGYAGVIAFWDATGDMVADATITLNPGDTYTATLYAEVTAPDDLLSWGGFADFDDTAATFQSVSTNTADWFIGGNPTDAPGGRVTWAKGRLGGGLTGLLELGSIELMANASHTLQLLDRGNTVDDWTSLNGDVFDPITPQLTVNVNAVPIPATVWLFGFGLASIFGIGRKRKV
jgi:hypothetical protein